MKQLELNIPEARQQRDAGIETATAHANAVHKDWSDKAFEKLKEFLQIFSDPFQAEEVRSFAAVDDDFPSPPSERSWGGVMLRAMHKGLIKKIGSQNTKAVKSHRTPAGLWQKV